MNTWMVTWNRICYKRLQTAYSDTNRIIGRWIRRECASLCVASHHDDKYRIHPCTVTIHTYRMDKSKQEVIALKVIVTCYNISSVCSDTLSSDGKDDQWSLLPYY